MDEKVRLLILVFIVLVISSRSEIRCRLFILKSNYRSKYLNDLPLSTEGARNCIEEVEAFYILQVEHLSTLITILAHVRLREKCFRGYWFLLSRPVITAASSNY